MTLTVNVRSLLFVLVRACSCLIPILSFCLIIKHCYFLIHTYHTVSVVGVNRCSIKGLDPPLPI